MNIGAASTSYKIYMLCVLTAAYTLSTLDRTMIMLLLQPIKQDLHLSDTELGTLTGVAFGVFYAVLGIPLARWADRGDRVNIIALAMALWGATVFAYAWASSFTFLLLLRVATAIGEAGCLPAAYSLLGDYFLDGRSRTRAMTVFMLATPLACLVGMVAAGWINQAYGWRPAFALIGGPGLILAVLVKISLRDPRRFSNSSSVQRTSPRAAFELIWQRRSLRLIACGIILLYAMGYGMAPWYAAYMIRTYGMGTTELGLLLGLIFGISGFIGILAGGLAAASWINERGQLALSALGVALIAPFLFAFLLAPSKYFALAALAPAAVVSNLLFGPVFALSQRLVPTNLRATSLAYIMLFANLIGMGLAPQIVGVVSDLLAPYFGMQSLREAMLATSLISVISAVCFWVARRDIVGDLAETEAAESNLPSLVTSTLYA